MSDERGRVITFVGESRREREVFDGTAEDARTYIMQNFPRLHVEPNTHYGEDGPPADAVLEDESRNRTFFDGKNWQDWRAPDQNAIRTNQPDDRDEEIARLRRELEGTRGEQASADSSDQEIARLRRELDAERAKSGTAADGSTAADSGGSVDFSKLSIQDA